MLVLELYVKKFLVLELKDWRRENSYDYIVYIFYFILNLCLNGMDLYIWIKIIVFFIISIFFFEILFVFFKYYGIILSFVYFILMYEYRIKK